MKTAKGKDNGCGTRRWAGNFRPAPTVGVGGDVYPIKNDAALVGRALATFGSAPTKSATAKLDSAPLRFRLTLTS
ncbi:MAG: hypothetical protein ACFNUE_08260 [Bacteroides sp.]